jgi:hypothetical protein
MNKQLGKLRKHAAGACLHILKTLAFLPAERIFGLWNWVSSVVRVREENSEFAVFSFELGAFAYFTLVLLHSPALLFCFALASKEKSWASTSGERRDSHREIIIRDSRIARLGTKFSLVSLAKFGS